ncbi:WDR76 [Bugula neritina]|uniref:WD repeat-containing protein 76 n=1 Tax=Bugula neritina TaxID=10212 RepID=A0A7J7KTB7_BUGNE|nr:WDR76 [Bugula neritina]
MQNTAQITAPVISWEDCIVPKGCSYSQTLTNRLAASCGPKPSVTEDLVDFVNICSLMSINSNLVAKVTPHRIYSIDLHSSLHNSPLVAAGDKWGHVGLWNVIPEKSSANDGVCLFKPHVSPVNCVKFSDYDQSTLFSSSYDGTVRRCDVNKQQFELVYSTPDEDDIQHMYLSEVDMNRVCVASTDSCIAYIDSRTSSVRSFDTQSGKLKCVSHHPIEKHYFITASVKGHVDLLPHKKGVLSAFFSPTSGEKILSCSAGDEIKVYNSTDMTNIETESSFYHNNFTGRWLSNFRASWHPSREDCFLIGSMKHPRQIDLIGCDGKLLHTFHDNGDLLQSVTSLNAFHPSLPFMAGGNSSGRVFVFMAQMDCL